MLEPFLAEQRCRQADRLIPQEARAGRLLDVGCGTYPMFLMQTRFAERYGLDRSVPTALNRPGLTLLNHDVAEARQLPFPNSFFNVVTMLAVFEHLDEDVLVNLLSEINRVLTDGGAFIMTTPARWTTSLLRLMSRLRLVSQEEVDEHKQQHTREQIVQLLVRGGFRREQIDVGTFELGVNLWARARSRG